MFQFRCPRCRSIVVAIGTVGGGKMSCPTCGQRLQVPRQHTQTVLAQFVPGLSNSVSSKVELPQREPTVAKTASRTFRRVLGLGGIAIFLSCILAGVLLLPRRHTSSRPPPLRSNPPDEAIAQTSPILPRPAAESRSESPHLDPTTLASRARTILKTHCYRCHGENGAAEGGFNFILDREQLLAKKQIKVGDAEHSKLYRRMREKEMPPVDEKPRPNAEEVQLIRQWIDNDAPTEPLAPPQRTFLSNSDIRAVMMADLLSLPARERRFVRYFTLTHLYNAGLSDDELQTYRHALSKLVNSLSWRARIVVPKAVDPKRTVFRIDVRDYSWNAKVWEHIAGVHPYGIRSDSPTAQAIVAATACEQPFVRGDWFVATAARPPLYHDLLQLPNSDVELEKQLKVDVGGDIEQERVARAGFNGSGVSRNNRLIERHELAFGGAYWKSYDFADNVGRHNLFSHPRGPGSADNTFEPSGGEILFHLPNGLQGYMLIDAHGQRIDKGPTAIVSDPRRPDRAVENGLSCMACHTRGVLPKTDQIRKHIEQNPAAFSADEMQLLKALYPPEDRFRALQEQDSERFRAAVVQTGNRIGATEPIVALTLQFESELDLKRTAAEVGCTPALFREQLAQSATLARSLGALKIPGGTIQRQVFTDAFAEIIRHLETGTPQRQRE